MKLESSSLPNGVKDVVLTGRLDIQGANAIENKFAYAVSTEAAPVVVDMSQVEFVASIGIRLLLMNAKALTRRGGKMVLYNPQPLVKDALVTAGIDLLIPIYDDLDAACADLLQATSGTA